MNKFAIAVHGGAGTIRKSEMTAEIEAGYRQGIIDALSAAETILAGGGSALDAVESAVVSLEDNPLFNAGCGSVFTHEGKVEMDAAIMDGTNLRAGAVAAVRNVKNPVRLARAVMERSEYVFLIGDGATRFAENIRIELRDNTYFYTDRRWQELEKAIEAGKVTLDHSSLDPRLEQKPIGTVGAVALDMAGGLAAATSTGGMTNKQYGRVGDTPLIGAGTYADELCAVSCTGHGEFFIRTVAAHDLAARIRFSGKSVTDAAMETIDRVGSVGGEGGLIAIDSAGNIAFPFNTEGMYRGYVRSGEQPTVAIYR